MAIIAAGARPLRRPSIRERAREFRRGTEEPYPRHEISAAMQMVKELYGLRPRNARIPSSRSWWGPHSRDEINADALKLMTYPFHMLRHMLGPHTARYNEKIEAIETNPWNAPLFSNRWENSMRSYTLVHEAAHHVANVFPRTGEWSMPLKFLNEGLAEYAAEKIIGKPRPRTFGEKAYAFLRRASCRVKNLLGRPVETANRMLEGALRLILPRECISKTLDRQLEASFSPWLFRDAANPYRDGLEFVKYVMEEGMEKIAPALPAGMEGTTPYELLSTIQPTSMEHILFPERYVGMVLERIGRFNEHVDRELSGHLDALSEMLFGWGARACQLRQQVPANLGHLLMPGEYVRMISHGWKTPYGFQPGLEAMWAAEMERMKSARRRPNPIVEMRRKNREERARRMGFSEDEYSVYSDYDPGVN